MLYNNHFIELLRQRSSSTTPALVNGDQSITAVQLLKESIALAHSLRTQGMQAGDMAVIATVPGVDFLRIIYATMMLRARVAIIDPEMGRDNYHAKLKQLNPNGLLQIIDYYYYKSIPLFDFFI